MLSDLATRAAQLRVAPGITALLRAACNYVSTDPQSAVLKCRIALERVLNDAAARRFGRQYPKLPLGDLMANDDLMSAIPSAVRDQMHRVRRYGNRAAHGDDVTSSEAALCLDALLAALEWQTNNSPSALRAMPQPLSYSDADETSTTRDADEKSIRTHVTEQSLKRC